MYTKRSFLFQKFQKGSLRRKAGSVTLKTRKTGTDVAKKRRTFSGSRRVFETETENDVGVESDI